jgi:hypothetical protein
MYDLSDKLTKLGYYAPSTSIDGSQPQQPKPNNGLPWGKLAITGLLGAGAAYGIGKMDPHGMLGGFAGGVDSHVINPVKNLFGIHPTGNPGQEMLNNANTAGFMGQFKDIHHDSQLQGTPYYQPGKIESAASLAATGAGLSMFASGAGRLARGGMKMVAPNMAARFGASTLGHGLSTGVNAIGKAAPLLGGALAVPDGLQLGSKLNDSLGIKNRLGRAAVTTGTTGASIGAGVAGAGLGMMGLAATGPVGWGLMAGGTLLGMAPRLINGVWNRVNRNKMILNGAGARAQQMKLDFQRALAAKQQGNNSLLQGWYGTQTPAQLAMTVKQFKGDPIAQQIQQYNPNLVRQ